MQNKRYTIEKLDHIHKKNTFSCGIASLDNYLHHQAGQDKKRQLSVTYLLYDHENNAIVGYYSLSSTSIESTDLPPAMTKKLPRYPLLPATLLGRLAVDHHYQHKGFGEILLIDALKRVSQLSESIASFAVIVEAINEKANHFYQKYGFLPLKLNKLFLPMASLDFYHL